jgi:protein tyrosine phosphatase (PTP) superfamily phosphohydrolase (DUF442 family)
MPIGNPCPEVSAAPTERVAEPIRNFRRLDEFIATGGQPTERQLAALAGENTQVVINLALPTSTYALPDERAIVTRLGLVYVPIPVVFEAPTGADFELFSAELTARRGQKIFVHCALNYWVSAFIALHRVRQLGWSRAAALAELHQIWEPDAVWLQFLEVQFAK